MKDVHPAQAGFRQPAEWEPHSACWLAWPADASLWQDQLEDAQESFTLLCKAIADPDPATGRSRGERLEILVADDLSHSQAQSALAGLDVRFHRIAYGDIWLRDTAPIFVSHASDAVAANVFRFNGWGGKYVLPFDDAVAPSVATASSVQTFSFPWVLEGGSVEPDGQGTLLTTRQCLLNPNRNPNLAQEHIEEGLRNALGIRKILWLDDGLLNDHTDGHIDTIARFVGPARVVCMAPSGNDDPNRAVLDAIARSLEGMTDAEGRKLEVARIPSPGLAVDEDGKVMPASYVNFYIGNRTVAVPVYGSPYDDAAVKALVPLFPGRRVIAIPAVSILSGGGAFHCITQHQPGSAR